MNKPMGLLPDWELTHLAAAGMIEPFTPRKVVGVASYGLSHFGYDIRAANEWRIFTPTTGQLTVIDPANIDERAMVEHSGEVCIIPPNSFALACSVEYIRMPDDVAGLMMVKSTYARCGITSPPTVLEPGWHGHITIEISNTTPLPAKIYAGWGIAQVLFFRGEACERPYAADGKYQGQTGITLPRARSGGAFDAGGTL